jgi:iron complex transport system substrate-binding protein
MLEMESKQVMIILLIVLLIGIAFASGYFLSESLNPSLGEVSPKKKVTVQDSAGRYVEVPYPVQSIVVLWDNPVEEIRALGAIDRIVGIDLATKTKVDEGFYPELVDIPVIGSWDEPNYEKIAELHPDVVIMLSSYPPLPDEVQNQLEPFGIAVVGLDFYRIEVYFQEIRTLGFMLGLEDKAEEYISFFQSKYNLIKSRIEGLSQDERKTVYFEGVDKYYTYGGADYGCGIPGIIRAAGGIDLYPEFSAYYFEVDPESVAVRNPDVILKGASGGYFLKDTTEFQRIREEIMSRPELANTTAIKNNDVYVISWDVAGGARKKFGPVFLAKILYPEKFQDLDPNEFLREYLEKYQKMSYQGVYVYPQISG